MITSIFLLIVICLIVFGGGQVFMPVFNWFWLFLANQFGTRIDENRIQEIFSITNSTPGVVSLKFAAVTGLVVANNEWWGIFLSIFFYFVFSLPAILLVILGLKVLKKHKNNPRFKKLFSLFKPAIAAIMISLAIQLFISIYFIQIYFNKSMGQYVGYSDISSLKNTFFTNWRYYVLLVFVPVYTLASFVMYRKKVPIFFIFLTGLVCAFIVFEPWLT
ncbi:chromate transporter [Mesomycoplasma hyorhinis]|uniref:chromate transporter n=1 Tax=Mesomycoplasma hyorhinis TaxID=2100 RepID=UPI00280A79F3